MDDKKFLAERFEQSRGHLRSVAYRMLGSMSEAEDAVQEAWLRLNRANTTEVNNLNAWLTTVVARVCLDMLRSHKARREEGLQTDVAASPLEIRKRNDPEQEAILADSVGLALMVVLERLSPGERLAFVLHDLFGQSFEEIAAVLEKTPAAVRQLASRARRRVQGPPVVEAGVFNQRRRVVESFLAALRAGDFAGLVAVLDPDVVVHIDKASAASGRPVVIRGAEAWARGAIQFAQTARFAHPMLLNGEVGAVVAPRGKLFRAVRVAFSDEGRIREVEIIGDKERLQKIEVQLPPVMDRG